MSSMPMNVVVDEAVVDGGGGGVGGRCGVVAVAETGRDGLAVLSAVDEVDGLAPDRKLDCTIC